MTIRGIITPSLTLALVACSQQREVEPVAEQPVVAIAAQPAATAIEPTIPTMEPPIPPPAPPPPTFAFAADLTGQALPRVVVPHVPVQLPNERFGAVPKPRTVPLKLLDPDSTPRASYTLPPLLPAKAVAAKLAPPPERVPLNLGAGADAIPAKPMLPVAAVVTERARDVNLLPPAPLLGRQRNDRVSVDDPTSEVGNSVVVAGATPVPLVVSGFLKVTVPDPFELAEHVRPKVPAAAEPSAVPVIVNPARVK